MKVASAAVPEGVWVRLPFPNGWEDSCYHCESLTLETLGVSEWMCGSKLKYLETAGLRQIEISAHKKPHIRACRCNSKLLPQKLRSNGLFLDSEPEGGTT